MAEVVVEAAVGTDQVVETEAVGIADSEAVVVV